jgi:uncharacterized MAPEG superfamily protein
VSIELHMLVFTSILGIVQLLAAAQVMTAQRGVKWNLGSREGKAAPLTGMAGRLERAFRNLLETFPFFAAAVLTVQLAHKNSSLTAIGAQVYFYARVLYFPVYAAGLPIVRTVIWCISLAGLCLMLWALLKVA